MPDLVLGHTSNFSIRISGITMNPPPSPPVPSVESRAETSAAIGDIYDLFDPEAEAPSPVRSF